MWRRGVEWAGLPATFRFHDLRHTGNTWAADGGANLRDLMERMGHSSTRAALIYLHASRSGDRRIADGIGRQMAAGGAGEDQGDDGATGARSGVIWHGTGTRADPALSPPIPPDHPRRP
jgi:hypothetical protein